MKIAVMQPYFFPYIGYFQLMHLCDEFIIFDTVQHKRKSWMNRNRILHPNAGPKYITVPLQKSEHTTLIKDIMINNDILDWKINILNQLEGYYRYAPFKKEVLQYIKECFQKEFESLSELNTYLLNKVCSYLNIDCRITVLSKANYQYESATAPDEWGLNICKALNIKTYLNAPGGRAFYNTNKYKAEQIEIQFINPVLKKYHQNSEQFHPGLSIIDIMMFNSKKEIHDMLNQYEVIR